MSSLPTADERVWLVDQLVDLMASAGWEPLVNAPLVEPDARFFPDRWSADAGGVRRMARRLLRYVGLDTLDVQVDIFDGGRTQESDGHGRSSERHEGAAAWFAGIEDGVCLFGAEAGGFEDPAVLAGTMAHEVAHVYRRVRGLEVDDRDLEERLTDLTTIFLGFGVLTTNASLKHRSHGDLNYHAWSRKSVGYLPPQAMSFLLALQVCARELDAAGRRHVAGLLETNQRAYFAAACTWIAAQLPTLGERLGLPDPSSWPDPPALGPLWAPIEEGPEALVAAPVKPVKPVGENAGRAVFRVHHTQAATFGKAAAVLGAIVGVFGSTGAAAVWWWGGAAAFVGLAVLA
ncbi:MAG TPA: hypothetical protein VGB85_10075, partial [Nannocystis sp.]